MKNFDFIKNEHEMLKLWDEYFVFSKLMKKNENRPRFRFLDGPVTANASMGVHHVWGRALKDAQIKYHALKGYSSDFQNGFDAQGMWVEVEVEKLLGLASKKDIASYGLAKFTEKCMERVNFYADLQTKQSIRLGQHMDWGNSYFTNSDHNITSIWHFLKVVHERGWLVKSYKSMPWCPRCGTSLSEHEMSGSYKELTHTAVFASVTLDPAHADEAQENLLVWTTTPWTLSANVAIAVNPEHNYVKARVKSSDRLLIVGKEALKRLRDDLIEVVQELKGSQLVGRTYTPPLALKIQNFEHKIIAWDEVSANEGSGAVHIAPGCGAEDFELAKKYGLAPIIPINEAGEFYQEFEYLAGLSTTEAGPVIFEKLKVLGALYYTHPYSHNYPFCWRCKTNVVFRLVEGWDIATEKIKPSIMDAIETVEWKPAFLKKSMQNWIASMGDWNISRRRFYGLPLPFYPCDCGHLTVIGSLEELRQLATDKSIVDNIPHLHRPYIDDIQVTCSSCKKAVKRVTDVGDCWLDAGIAPFSTKKYFTDKAYFKQNFPAQVVIEMKEQVRLWFYSQLFMSVVLLNKAPYECVVAHGTMLDENGKKQSKTDPNSIKLDTALEEFGADAMRYTVVSANPSLDMRFGPGMIEETRRKMMGMLNSVGFFNTYAEIDKPNVTGYTPKQSHITDVWLTDAVNNYIIACDQAYAEHSAHKVIEYTEKLMDDLSNFYIRTNRRRFWKSEVGEDKLHAYWILYHTLKSVAIIMTPITPFMSEFIWQNMVRKIEKDAPVSVLLSTFPHELKASKKIKDIASKVEFVQKITTQAHSLRASCGLKIKQPLRTLYIKTEDTETIGLFADYLREELNVKVIEPATSEDQFNIPYLVVNFRNAGKQLGQRAQELKKIVESWSQERMREAVEGFEKNAVEVEGFGKLPPEVFDRKLKSKPEYVSLTEGNTTVVLDTTLDTELIEEGKLREIIRAIQVARQTANLEITARIKLGITTKSDVLKSIIQKNKHKIMQEVLAHELTEDTAKPSTQTEIDGEILIISVV